MIRSAVYLVITLAAAGTIGFVVAEYTPCIATGTIIVVILIYAYVEWRVRRRGGAVRR